MPSTRPHDLPRRYASIDATAEYIGVSPKTVRRLISAGTLTGYRIGPRLLRVDLAELDQAAHPIPTADSHRRGGDAA